LLLAAGTRLGAVHVGLLAAAGHGAVLARPRPRVTVISTGDELVEPGTGLIPGQIWESNATMLAAAARNAGCPARRYPIVRDTTSAVLAAVQDALEGADALITSGGVSMGGEHDVVKAALATLGTVSFRKVAMQPGMPQGFGTVGPANTPIFTLPGNPVSTYVSFCLFVQPALDALQDSCRERTKSRQAVLAGPVHSPAEKRSFLRGILDEADGLVTPVSGQASHQLASLARANALIIVPEEVTSLAAGETVDVMELP
jgi:molybdopterin molybdotransferase